MPLSDHEQRILDEIERRLAEDDPRLVEQVGRTTLSAHLTRRIRLASFAFLIGLVLLMLFTVALWVAAAGFLIMVLSLLLGARYLKQLGKDQVRALQQEDRFSVAGVLAKITARIRRRSEPSDEE